MNQYIDNKSPLLLYQHAYVLQFVFHVLPILRLEIKLKKGLFYQYDDQMTTQYVYHRTHNDKIVWTPNVIYYVTSNDPMLDMTVEGKRLGQIMIYPYGNQKLGP